MNKYPKTKFKQTVLHLVVSGCYLNTAMAQIIADYSAPAAQRPAVLKGNNNQPIVNIQTPNNKGLSHNRYTQFDIDNKGVILNNHRTNNPHLAKGTAKVILNEVRSNQASQINGEIQVAGHRADVIIANPIGISINGASTQNINQMIFTSGMPQIKNNTIENINVEKGTITVGKQGLNSHSNYTQLIGRAIEIQGEISADKLLVSAGGQLADYPHFKIQEKNGDPSSKPQIGIDTSALGGMYANHIHLVTNEYGVGVRNAGELNAKATLWIDSSGKIENKGTIQADEKQVIRTKYSGENGDILLQPKSKITGSADTLVSTGGRMLVNQATFSQTKSQSVPQAQLSLLGNSIIFNAGRVDTPNPLSVTTTSDALKLEAATVNSKGKLSAVLNEKQNKQKLIENEINHIKQNEEYTKLKNEINVLMSRFHHLERNNLSLLEIANQKQKMLQPFDDKIKELEHKKSELNTLTSILNRNGDIQTPQFTEINAGDITFNLAGGLDIQGANLHSNKNITINSYGSSNNKTISIQSQHLLAESGSGDDYSYVSIYQPSILNAKNNITLNALQPNGNNRIEIKGSKLNAENGVVNIAGYSDVILDHAKEEYYRYHQHSYKHGNKIKKKTTTVINEQQHSYAVPTVISAKNGISITAGEHLKLFASELNAPQNKISLTAGKGLSLYAVEEQHKMHNESHTQKRFLGIKTGSSHHEREQILNEQLPVKLVAQSAHLKSGWNTLLQGTQFQTLTGAKIEAGVGEKARGDAKILLQGIKSSVQNEESKRKTGIVWQSFQNKGLIEESLALPTFTGGKPLFNASGGIVVDMPKGKLRNELEALLKKPEYAYLKNLKLNDNVQWKEVSLAYQQWDYKQQGLTGAGAAIIALAMAAVTSGVGAGIVSGLNGTYAAMANTAFTSLTTQATTSLINNQGNINQTFKDLGSKQQVRQFATTVISAGVADKLVGTVNINTGSGLLDTLGNNLINASSTAVVQVGIKGGKFTKALENAIYNALIDTAHAELAKNIKGIQTQADANKWYREAAHKIAHAVAGCGAATGRGGKCTDGALGAVLGEVVGELLTKNKTRNEIDEIEVINKTKLIVGSVAAVLGKDVNMSVAAAHIAVKFNTVNKEKAGTIEQFLKEMNDSPSKVGMQTGKNAEDTLIKFSNVDRTLSPNFVSYFNTRDARYIYTEKAGWIDMVHFLFYAGLSYDTKRELLSFNRHSTMDSIENRAIGRAMAYGYGQEITDLVRARHSAFEYEDLVSDKQGAIFGAKHFDPKSNLDLGQQVKLFFEKELKATQPKVAPNYHQLPVNDTGKHSGIKNYTTSPLFNK